MRSRLDNEHGYKRLAAIHDGSSRLLHGKATDIMTLTKIGTDNAKGSVTMRETLGDLQIQFSLFFFSETGTDAVAHAGLELAILLSAGL